jgi:importin subunit alpha-1/8
LEKEMRARRHDVTIELRKNKKDDQLNKRRNIDIEDPTSPLQEVNGQSPVQLTLEEIVAGCNSRDKKREFAAVQAARKMLSRERNPPIDTMIGLGIVPICVKFLANADDPLLQFEAAWALTNIASGTSEQTKAVVQANAVPAFVALMASPNTNVAEQAVWALGNIAGDGSEARDIVYEHNAVAAILNLIEPNSPVSCNCPSSLIARLNNVQSNVFPFLQIH